MMKTFEQYSNKNYKGLPLIQYLNDATGNVMKTFEQFGNEEFIPFQVYKVKKTQYDKELIFSFICYNRNDKYPYDILILNGTIINTYVTDYRISSGDIIPMNMTLIEYLEEHTELVASLYKNINTKEVFYQKAKQDIIKYLEPYSYLKDSEELGLL